MTTKITLGLEGSTREGATIIFVREDFDEVLEKFWPLNTPGTTLETRGNNIFTSLDGKRILIKTPAILIIEEDVEE